MYVSTPGAALLSRASQAILRLSRPTKRLVMLGADAVMLPACLLMALILKFDRFVEPDGIGALLVCAVVCGVIAFSILGFYRAVIRFMGVKAIAQ